MILAKRPEQAPQASGRFTNDFNPDGLVSPEVFLELHRNQNLSRITGLVKHAHITHDLSTAKSTIYQHQEGLGQSLGSGMAQRLGFLLKNVEQLLLMLDYGLVNGVGKGTKFRCSMVEDTARKRAIAECSRAA